jgi:hypothetical protein
MAYQYREGRVNKRVHTPCFSLEENLIKRVKLQAKKEGQTPSRIVQRSLRILFEYEEFVKNSLKESEKVYKLMIDD